MKSAQREQSEHCGVPETELSKKMASIGIIQAGQQVLYQHATPFDLPAEVAEARRVLSALRSVMDLAATIHHFAKGMGVAAPQLGIGRSAAVIRSEAGEVVELINPRITDSSAQTDEQYEGCWSFFDVRGKVRRPLHLQVAHHTLDGTVVTTRFSHATARLVAHEVDHLQGVLYTERMDLPARLVPIAEYRQRGVAWKYPS